MSIHFGLTDYGRLKYMLNMADLLKEKKKFEIMLKEPGSKQEELKKKIQET